MEVIKREKAYNKVSMNDLSEEFAVEWICLFGGDDFIRKMYTKLNAWFYVYNQAKYVR